MSLDQFIAERQPRWLELEAAITTARHGIRSLPVSSIERFGMLQRHASSDLAIARRDYPDATITEYLNGLCSRAHPLLYRGTTLHARELPRFFAFGLPRAFRAAWPYMVAS